jgi:S-adenosylmethionine hydrolase
LIVVFCDFGVTGPYLGQMKAVLYRHDPGRPVVELFADAPRDPRVASYLLAAYAQDFPPPAVFLCVVDPGVGGERAACALRIDRQWFVGPDNGLLNVVAMRARGDVEWWDIEWRPERLSRTFHGRDLFAPVAARLAGGELPPGMRCDAEARIDRSWPEDLFSIVYADGYGNLMTGIRAEQAVPSARLVAGGHTLGYAARYGEVPTGMAFWYGNANGLVEIAVSGGSAAETLGLHPGDAVGWAE